MAQYLKAAFKPGTMGYSYINNGPPVAAGDRVLVSGKGGNGTRVVTVTEIMDDRPSDLPAHVQIKAIIGPAPDVEPAPKDLLS